MLEVPFFWATTRIQVDLVVRVVVTARAIRIVTHTVFAPLFAQRSRIALLHTPHAYDGRIRFIAHLDACRRLHYPLEKTICLKDVHRLGVYIETAFEGETGASEGCSSLNAPAPPEQQKPAIRCDCWFFLYLSMLCGAKNVADLR